MKALLIVASLLFGQIVSAGPSTAYTVLRVIGKQKGQDSLNRVLELRGRNGAPQPAVWKVTLAEPSARGGVREIEVQDGQIFSERTPTNRQSSGAAMDFNRLNLDSDGLFTVVNQEMQQDRIPFDRIDYVLRSAEGTSPVWSVELFEAHKGRVATMQVAADTGSILTKSGKTVTEQGPVTDHDYVRPVSPDLARPDDEPPYQGKVARDDSGHSKPGEPFRDVGDFFHRLGKRVERHGQTLENFFTGKKHSTVPDRDAGRD